MYSSSLTEKVFLSRTFFVLCLLAVEKKKENDYVTYETMAYLKDSM